MTRGNRRQLTIVGQREATLEGQTVSYILKRSPRANYARLEVRSETGLTVVIPERYKSAQIPSLLKEKSRWILRKLAEYGQAHILSHEKGIKSGDTIPYLGRDLEVVTEQAHGKADNVKLEQRRLVVSLGSQRSKVNLALEWWYREQAEKLIRKRADELCARLGVKYGRLTIRGVKTRWGSCSHKGNLNFNWKLIMAPEPVVEYVIIHELAHLKEMNHAKRFWELVAELCPGWRDHRRWLKSHEAGLATSLSA